jgi:hypothetical protein
MKDGAIIACRVFWEMMGVVLDSRLEFTPRAPTVTPKFRLFTKFPSGVSMRSFSKTDFDALPCSSDIVLVLVAANKCVAHIDEYPDHGVSDEILDRVIDTTITEFDSRISQP